jgi:hypothetical protein
VEEGEAAGEAPGERVGAGDAGEITEEPGGKGEAEGAPEAVEDVSGGEAVRGSAAGVSEAAGPGREVEAEVELGSPSGSVSEEPGVSRVLVVSVLWFVSFVAVVPASGVSVGSVIPFVSVVSPTDSPTSGPSAGSVDSFLVCEPPFVVSFVSPFGPCVNAIGSTPVVSAVVSGVVGISVSAVGFALASADA